MSITADLSQVLGVDAVKTDRGWYIVVGGDLARVVALHEARRPTIAADRIGISLGVLRRIVAGLAVCGDTLTTLAGWLQREGRATGARSENGSETR